MERKFNAKLLTLFLLIGTVICAVFAYLAINNFSNNTAQAEDNDTYISAPEQSVTSGGLYAEQMGDEISAPETEAKATATTIYPPTMNQLTFDYSPNKDLTSGISNWNTDAVMLSSNCGITFVEPYGFSIPAGTRPGTYYIYATIKNSLYTFITGGNQYTYTLTINDTTISIADCLIGLYDTGYLTPFPGRVTNIKPNFVTYNGVDLVEGTDYTLSYGQNSTIGTNTGTVTITGIGHYTDSVTKKFDIRDGTLLSSYGRITLDTTSYTYDGTAKEPTVTVTVGNPSNGGCTFGSTSYSVSYSNNINAGTATVTVTGKGGYSPSGSCSETFTIDKYNLSNATITLSPTSYTYDGTAKTPTVSSVKMGSTTIASSNYTVTYSNNINAGTTATATVTATTNNTNFTGSGSKTFTIKKASAQVFVNGTQSKINISYGETVTLTASARDLNGNAVTIYNPATEWWISSDVVMVSGLTSGTYGNPATITATEVGDGSCRVKVSSSTLGSNYNMDAFLYFTISVSKASLSSATVTLSTSSCTYNGSAQTPSVSSVVLNSNTVPSSDYTVNYSNNTNAGTATVTVTATSSSSHYTGFGSTTFTINKATQSLSLNGISSNYPTVKIKCGEESTLTVTGGISYIGDYSNTYGYQWEFLNNSHSSLGLDNKNQYGNNLKIKPTAVGNIYGTLIKVGDTNYSNTTLYITITVDKGDYDMTGAGWDYTSPFTYDGSAKTVSVTGLPEGVTVASYTGNTATAADDYTASVTLSYDTTNYNAVSIADLNWKINKADYDMTGAGWDYTSPFTYDGSEKSVTVTGLPDGVTVASYTGNTATAADDYTASVTLSYDTANYNAPSSIADLSWKINKGDYDMTGAGWDYTSPFTYDGSEKSVTVTGLPDGVTVASYTGNTATAADDYTASVTLSYDTANYNPVSIADLDWKINKGDYDISGIVFEDVTETYNEGEHFISYSGSRPTGVSITGYTITDGEGNVENVNYAINAGVYTVALVFSIEEPDNYNMPVKTATLTINKATPTATVTLPTGEGIWYYIGDNLPAFDGLTTSSSVDGTFSWDGDGKITAASGSYGWTFTPEDSNNYEEVTDSEEVTAVPKLISPLEVVGAKATYKAFESFRTSGITITANYQTGKDSTVININDCTIIYPSVDGHFVLADNGKELTISYTENGQTATFEITVTIDANTYDLSNITVTGSNNVVYNEQQHKLEIGNLPDGLNVTGYKYTCDKDADPITDGGAVNVGVWTVEAIFDYDEDNYIKPEWSATLTITQAETTVVGVELVKGRYYKGAALSTVHLTYDVDATSPEGSIDWVDGAIKLGSADDGRYQWVYTPNDSRNYKTVEGWLEITNLTAKVEEIEVINPTTAYGAYESFASEGVKVLVTYLDETTQEIDLSDCTFLYPDITRNHFLAGDENITVWYGNVSTTVTVTVSKKPVDMLGVTFDDELNEVYNGELKSIIAENLPDGVEIAYYTYNGETLDGVTDVGTYEVKAYFNVTVDPDNVAVPDPMTATLKIAQGTPDITVEVDYGYKYPAGSTLSDVKLKYECNVAGTLNWTVGSQELEDDGEYEWTFKPADTKNYKTVKGTLTVEIYYEVNSIQVTVNKSVYEAYDKLGKTDITVKAIFTNKAPANVDGWTVTYPNGGDCFLVDDTDKDVIITYNDATYVIHVTVNKKTVDTSGVTFDDANEVYSGGLKSITATNLPDGVEVDYYTYNDQTANGVTDAGDYSVTVYFKVTDENLTVAPVSKTAQLHIDKADSVLTFNGTTEFPYTGETVTITNGASVDNGEQTEFGYTNNAFLNVSDSGMMTVTVAASKNYNGTSIEVPVTINPAELTLTWTGGNATYDGYSHSAELKVVSGVVNKDKEDITTESLSDLITVSYTGSDPDRKQKGDYTVTLESFPESGLYANYTYVITNDPYTFTITDGVLNIKFNGDAVVYDGEPHTLSATGLPAAEEMTVTYYCNGEVFTSATDAGEYEIEARFTSLTDNFTAPSPITATLTISTKSISGCDVDGVDEQHIYDGKAYSPQNVTVKLEVNGNEVTLEKGKDFEVTNAGSGASAGNTGKIVITGKGNYGGSVEIGYTIIPRELDVEWDEGEYFYNGTPQGVTARLTNVVDGEEVNIETTYVGTGYESTAKPTKAGTYTATVTLDTPYGNYTFTVKSKTFEIKMADVDVELQYAEDFDGSNLYHGMAMPTVTAVATTADGKEVDGDFKWVENSFVWGTEVYGWTFVPNDSNYNVKQGTANFTVREAKISSLTVDWIGGEQPEIYISTTLDTIRSYLVVTGTLENDQTIDIAGYALTCDAFSGAVPSRPGTYTLKARFNGKEDTVSVKYDDVVCSGLTVEAADGKEIKTDYFVFDKFDTTTLKVTATFTDKTERVLTDTEYTVVYATGGETVLMGDIYVKISYNEIEKPIYVTVSKKPYDTSSWGFDDKTSVYDGNGQSYKIEGLGDDFYAEYEYYKQNADKSWTKLASKDEVKNAGKYKIVATILPVGNISDNYSYPESLESLFTITKLTPDIGKPGVGGNLSVGTKLSELTLSVEVEGITGTFVWDNENQVLKEGVNVCRYTFIPDDANYNIVKGSIELPAGGTVTPGGETVSGSGISTGALVAIIAAVAVTLIISVIALSVAFKKKPGGDSDGFYDDVTPDDLN